MMSEKLLTIAQIANYLSMKQIEISRLVRQGEMPYAGGTPVNPLFSKDATDAWASNRIIAMNEERLADYNKCATRAIADSESLFSIGNLIDERRIEIDLSAKTKPSVLRDMTKFAEELGLLYDPKDLLDVLTAREELGSTALADGVAILHPRQHDPFLAPESFLLLARASHPIHFGAPDGSPTDVFFLLVCQDSRNHLKALARLCMMLMRTNLLAEIRFAENATEIINAIAEAEREVTKDSLESQKRG